MPLIAVRGAALIRSSLITIVAAGLTAPGVGGALFECSPFGTDGIHLVTVDAPINCGPANTLDGGLLDALLASCEAAHGGNLSNWQNFDGPVAPVSPLGCTNAGGPVFLQYLATTDGDQCAANAGSDGSTNEIYRFVVTHRVSTKKFSSLAGCHRGARVLRSRRAFFRFGDA